MSAKLARRKPQPRPCGRDFHAWTVQQSAALAAGRPSDLDWVHLAEEIADSGNEVFDAFRSSFRIILVHLLRWDRQPERRTRSWVTSIRSHRQEVEDILARSPSLRSRLDEAVESAYRRARIEAAGEMDRPERTLPSACPYGVAEIMERPIPWDDD